MEVFTPPLSSNKQMVFSRLQEILNKLNQSPGYLEAYNKIILQQLKAGFIEKPDEASDAKSAIPLHYLVHHAMVKESYTRYSSRYSLRL